MTSARGLTLHIQITTDKNIFNVLNIVDSSQSVSFNDSFLSSKVDQAIKYIILFFSLRIMKTVLLKSTKTITSM